MSTENKNVYQAPNSAETTNTAAQLGHIAGNSVHIDPSAIPKSELPEGSQSTLRRVLLELQNSIATDVLTRNPNNDAALREIAELASNGTYPIVIKGETFRGSGAIATFIVPTKGCVLPSEMFAVHTSHDGNRQIGYSEEFLRPIPDEDTYEMSDEQVEELVPAEYSQYFEITEKYRGVVDRKITACLSQLTGWDDQTTPPESIAFAKAAIPYL
jgi:hypothetical protein